MLYLKVRHLNHKAESGKIPFSCTVTFTKLCTHLWGEVGAPP